MSAQEPGLAARKKRKNKKNSKKINDNLCWNPKPTRSGASCGFHSAVGVITLGLGRAEAMARQRVREISSDTRSEGEGCTHYMRASANA